MKLYVRLLMAFVRAWLQPPISLLEECVSPLRVWITDHDPLGHMTNSRYFQLTDIGILEYMMRTKALWKLARRGWMPHVLYEDLVMKKSLRFPHRFKIRTRVAGWDADYLVISQIFERADGKVAAEGFTVARFMSAKGEKIATARVLDVLGEPVAAPAMPRAAAMALQRALEGYGLAETPAPAESPAAAAPVRRPAIAAAE